jgi:hypothetical protein
MDEQIDVPSYYAGYYDAAEEILNWMRSNQFTRKNLEKKLVAMQPRRMKDVD